MKLKLALLLTLCLCGCSHVDQNGQIHFGKKENWHIDRTPIPAEATNPPRMGDILGPVSVEAGR